MGLWNRVRAAAQYLRSGELPLEVIETSYNSEPGLRGVRPARTATREEALQYVPLARCIDLIAAGASEMISSTLRVVDDNGDLQDSPRIRAAVRLLRRSPDGIHTGSEFMKDLMGDFLLDGNALVHVVKSRGSMYDTPVRLERLAASTACTIIGDRRTGLLSLVYRATPFGESYEMTYPARDIVHAKFMPRDARYVSQSGRTFFARSPLEMLARTISIGRRTDAWVDSFFDEAARNDLAITVPAEAMGSQAEKRLIDAYHVHMEDKRAPLWLHGGATATQLSPTPQNASALGLREYGVQEVGRFYGVPAPLIGLHVTQWGSGIEQLARLYYRFGVRLHIDKLLDALSFRMLPEGFKFEVDPTQEVRGDMNAISSFVAAMRPSTNNPGVMSLQEVRDYIGARGEYVDDWGFKPAVAAGMKPMDDDDDK